MKLLIVDDEPLILKRLEQLIVSSAVGIHEVYATSNPAEALEMLKECAPQILITDIRMRNLVCLIYEYGIWRAMHMKTRCRRLLFL